VRTSEFTRAWAGSPAEARFRGSWEEHADESRPSSVVWTTERDRREDQRGRDCARTPLTRRENEAAFLEKLGEGTAKGTAWERITDLIALENSRALGLLLAPSLSPLPCWTPTPLDDSNIPSPPRPPFPNDRGDRMRLTRLAVGPAMKPAFRRPHTNSRLRLTPESKTIRPSVPGGSDLARMKEILLALKREGDKAPGAAGF